METPRPQVSSELEPAAELSDRPSEEETFTPRKLPKRPAKTRRKKAVEGTEESDNSTAPMSLSELKPRRKASSRPESASSTPKRAIPSPSGNSLRKRPGSAPSVSPTKSIDGSPTKTSITITIEWLELEPVVMQRIASMERVFVCYQFLKYTQDQLETVMLPVDPDGRFMFNFTKSKFCFFVWIFISFFINFYC